MIIISLVILLGHSTSGQHYPNCGNCQRDDVVIISQPPLSYTTMRSDEFFGTQPNNDGCTPIDGQDINCGVGTTLMDCERGPTRNINFSDLSDYFVWRLINSLEVRNVSVVFRFDQPVNIRRISMWFWYAPNGGITLPSLTLYSSNDDSTTPSNQISIDTSDSPVPVENRQYRLNVDITNDGLMVQLLRIMMTISWGTHIFLSEVLFCVGNAPVTNITTTNTVTITAISSTAATTISTTSTVSTLETYLTTTGTAVSTILSSLTPPSFSAPISSLGSTSSSNSSSSNIGLIVGVILAVIIITVIIIVVVVIVVVVVWKGKRSVSTKPEGVYYSTIDEGTLQTSLPNKPEPIYTEMSDEQNSAKNISNTSPTQQHVTMQDNPAYSDVVNDQVKLQDNPAYGSTSVDIKN